MKSLKFKSHNFCHSAIRVIDNGSFLGIIVGKSVPQSVLVDIFGHLSEDEYDNIYELNCFENENSTRMRELIETLREKSELYFLPLKVFMLNSEEFYSLYGEYLYDEVEHQRYFLRLINKIKRN